MKPTIITLVAFVTCLPLTGPQAETGSVAFAEGLEAYDGGDYAEARDLWQDSAHLGHVDAMTALADLLMRGHGGPADHRAAIALYRQASRLGDATASLTLGILALGDETTQFQDYLGAYVWFSVARLQGSAWAGKKARELRRKLSEPEHAMATKMINKKLQPGL